MSYEYTVNIPANKRAAFRKYVTSLGGSLSRARKVEDDYIPNATTIAAMKEAESGVELQDFDMKAFREIMEAL